MRASLLVLAAVLLLGAGELACRSLGAGAPNDAEAQLLRLLGERPVFPPRGGGAFATAPDLVGLNNPEERFSDPPSSGTLRVVCVGDSTTRGWPYHQRGSYPAWLAAFLSDLGVRAEVLNAGFHGFDSTRAAGVARELAAHRPSVLLFRAGFNDAGLLRLRESRGPAVALHLFLLRHSRLYSFLRRGPKARLAIGGADPRPLSREQARRLAERYRGNLALVAGAARAAGAIPVFLDLADARRCGASRQCAALQEQLRSFAAADHDVLVPLARPLASARYVDDVHLDWDGYRRLALAAARALCADARLKLRCRWERLKPTPAYVAQLGLDDGEFLAHVHVGLALMRLAQGDEDAARAELAQAQRVAPNPDLVPAELRQFRDSRVLALLSANE